MKPNDGSDVGKYKNYQGILATGGSKEGKPTTFIVHDILQEGYVVARSYLIKCIKDLLLECSILLLYTYSRVHANKNIHTYMLKFTALC